MAMEVNQSLRESFQLSSSILLHKILKLRKNISPSALDDVPSQLEPCHTHSNWHHISCPKRMLTLYESFVCGGGEGTYVATC